MNFETFATEFLFDLKNNNSHALSLLDANGKYIQEYLSDDVHLKTLDRFTQEIGKIVIETNKGKFGLIESALKHKAMTIVYHNFVKSDVMVKAFEMENKYAVKWLQTMQINPFAQDEQGRNALMFAVQKAQWNPYIKEYALNEKCVNQVDKNGRSALFYAVRNLSGLMELMKYDVNVNIQDCDGNNVLLYCCKNEIYSTFEYLVKNKVDVNAVDRDGRTVAMYLAIQGKCTLIPVLHSNNCDFNYMNIKGETVLSLLLNQMYGPEADKCFKMYIRTLIALISTKAVNFNMPIDEDENTPLMIMLLVNDFSTFNFVIKFAKDVDLSVKNKYGESVTSLFIKNRKGALVRNVINHSTFDYAYVDPIYKNNVLMLTAITQPLYVADVLKSRPRTLNEVNIKGENALMLACKANQISAALSLINHNLHYHSLDINAQDQMGNTALYYAVARQNPIIAYHLMEKGANSQIKNLQGKSAMDLAYELGDTNVLDVLQGRMTANTIKKIDPLYRGKEGGDLTMLKEIEEYLYYCIGTSAYANFELTENMIKTERSQYKEIESKIKSDNNGIEVLILFGLMFL